MARDAKLAGSRLFEGLTEDELAVVAQRMRPRQFAPGAAAGAIAMRGSGMGLGRGVGPAWTGRPSRSVFFQS